MQRIFATLLLSICFIVPAHAGVRKSTLDDQKNIEVTVYNSNLALIKDVRKLSLPRGEGELRFMDVAAYIKPETVHVKSLREKDQFSVLEQNYEYDLMDRNKLLDKFVGKDIKLSVVNNYTDKKEEVKATLLSNNNGQQIYEIDGEIHLGHRGMPILPEIPENLIAKPTLTWLYKNAAKVGTVEVSYLTHNMSWKADYVLIANQDDTMGDISGWVTIDNRSGTIFRDAGLKLIAGEVNVASPAYPASKRMRGGMQAFDMVAESSFQQQGFFEYHLYDLQRRTTLKNNQSKQINLLEASGFDIEKEYLVYGIKTAYTYQYREQNPKQPVNVNIKFKNSKDNKLGMPLPKGVVRLYKKDNEGSQQFIGEDSIEHTPKDEEISLKVGEAFDLVAERRQTDFRNLGGNVYESEWEITLKNRKEEGDVTIGIVEPLYGSWQVIENTHNFKKLDSFTVRFDVPVKKDKEVKVKYRIRIKG